MVQLKTLARVAMGHRASWHWLAAFAGPTWPCSSAESSYCVHLSPIAFLSVGVDEDICSSPWSNDPLTFFFQRQPDCRPSAQGIVGVLIPRGPRFKIELVSSRSREHCERHNSFSCSEKTVACRCAASYRRGLVSAAAARPLPRQPSPTRKRGADSSAPGRTRRRGNALQLSAARPLSPWPLGRPSAERSPRGVVVATRGLARRAKGNPSLHRRGASPQRSGGIFHLIRSTL